LTKVQQYLTSIGISYELDPRLVRGLDYYTNTAFEIMYAPLGAQSTVCGGGRYDGLIEEVGGPSTPGIGFAIGMERLLLTLEGTGSSCRRSKRSSPSSSSPSAIRPRPGPSNCSSSSAKRASMLKSTSWAAA
jgi:histidyl-tRNA synthetase